VGILTVRGYCSTEVGTRSLDRLREIDKGREEKTSMQRQRSIIRSEGKLQCGFLASMSFPRNDHNV